MHNYSQESKHLSKHKAGEIHKFDGIEFIYCPPGSFAMGTDDSVSDEDERPAHEVEITKGFWLSKYPITNTQWKEIMGELPVKSHIADEIVRIRHPYGFSQMWCYEKEEIVSVAGNHPEILELQKEGKLPRVSILEPYISQPSLPVSFISWYDAMALVFKLNNSPGLAFEDFFGHASEAKELLNQWEENPKSCFIDSFKKERAAIESELLMSILEMDSDGLNLWPSRSYRLPTEAEWEYACRAGTNTPWFWGDERAVAGQYSWYSENSNLNPQIVGQKKPNPWGFHDMVGNVWEWVLDIYDSRMYKEGDHWWGTKEESMARIIKKMEIAKGLREPEAKPNRDPVISDN
jgi:formylglycine-generating enzyme required for sulfatase activity